ncbi:phenylalanyl-tRNA synthetase, beta subunit [Microbotryum lychnidis-dioicae p1A1 Lamole]|uniref:phenylalanine--tRNA ligase n=1 Tax=Microbotryum lychnidis-dioicae (strain p1A1 Lamole / MvSl-1064) TaxID=683840 RepID=U5H6P7_USTV1|nr:phenylalanyl-tRNA synthetase, beta subunit [Microbotryum lychnidis-dioicae p1A1 Lamole]|eukprot:KDE06749.1 phenylalanyl-tRNA synthetase, beta subunit [Microbotryum lychnidis-dioicae p1A1 Lamole]
MPTITCDRATLFRKLGRNYTYHEFDELLFEYGLELDEDTTNDPNHPANEPHQLKIEVPANRYDLLCAEGIARALALYLDPTRGAPNFVLKPAKEGEERTVHVKPETAQIRPYFASAILRNVSFDAVSYASFIDLQDKLHQNLARKRTLVAVGTHDLDKIDAGDITYEALPPTEIKFAPLNKETEYTAVELMQLYKDDKHLSRYLHIIEDSPVYPIIYSSTRQVLSMPPIINSNGTKISVDTKNIFIDVTATDETKLQVVIDILVTMFSEYCSTPFEIEPVKIVYSSAAPGGARTVMSPVVAPRPFVARTSYVNSCTGLKLTRPEVVTLLRKMGHVAYEPTPEQIASYEPVNAREGLKMDPNDVVHLLVPSTRPDILHECDVMEEAAVAYGFNNLKKTFPVTNTVAVPFPINKLADSLRRLCAEAGWTEVLPLILCSHDENYKFLNRVDNGDKAVVLANPKTIEYQIVRTSLLPGILKTIRENRKHAIPLKVFEVSDIVVKDSKEERQAKNVRRLAAVFCGRRAGFEIVHGLLDRLMLGLGIKNLGSESSTGDEGYYIKSFNDATYFPDRSAKIYYRPSATGAKNLSFAPVASADVANASGSLRGPKEDVATPADSSSGPLDKIKDALSSALPHIGGTEHDGGSSSTLRDIEIGEIGILHPSVLKAYDLDYPCSALEFSVEDFL